MILNHLDTLIIAVLAIGNVVQARCLWLFSNRLDIVERRLKMLEGTVVLQGKVQVLHSAAGSLAHAYARNPENNDRD